MLLTVVPAHSQLPVSKECSFSSGFQWLVSKQCHTHATALQVASTQLRAVQIDTIESALARYLEAEVLEGDKRCTAKPSMSLHIYTYQSQLYSTMCLSTCNGSFCPPFTLRMATTTSCMSFKARGCTRARLQPLGTIYCLCQLRHIVVLGHIRMLLLQEKRTLHHISARTLQHLQVGKLAGKTPGQQSRLQHLRCHPEPFPCTHASSSCAAYWPAVVQTSACKYDMLFARSVHRTCRASWSEHVPRCWAL